MLSEQPGVLQKIQLKFFLVTTLLRKHFLFAETWTHCALTASKGKSWEQHNSSSSM